LQPWWVDTDDGTEHADTDVEEVLFAMQYKRCHIDTVRLLLSRYVPDPEHTLRAALDLPDTPLLLEGWWPGPSGRHWDVQVFGPGGRLHAHALVPRVRPAAAQRRLLLTP